MNNSKFWGTFVPRAMNIYASVIFLILWVGFAAALIIDRAWLDLVWNWVQALPAAPKVIIWLVFLPVMVGLWIWESSWSTTGQLAGLAGIIIWTLIALVNFYRVFKPGS